MVEPTRERVEAYEATLGCEPKPPVCRAHPDEAWTDLGCPVAVAAARVEAERVAEVEGSAGAAWNEAMHQLWEARAERDALRKHLDNVTSVNGWKEHEARMVKAEREREALKERAARAQELTAEAEDALETLTNILTALHRTVY